MSTCGCGVDEANVQKFTCSTWMLGKLGLLPISLQVYLLHTPVRNAVGLGDREEAGLRLRYSIKIASISVLQLFDCQFCGSLHMMNMMSFG